MANQYTEYCILLTEEEKKKRKKQYRIDHIVEQKEYDKQRYLDNAEETKQRVKQYRINNIDKIRKYCVNNTIKINKRRKQYYIRNSNRINKIRKQYRINNPNKFTERRKTDIQYKLSCNLRARLHNALRGNYKVGSAVRDCGCSMEELKKHLEFKFEDGMTWQNWSRNGWHVDHIIPLSKFNLQDRVQFLIANNYTNLQPMWAKDNCSKQDLHVLDYRDGMF